MGSGCGSDWILIIRGCDKTTPIKHYSAACSAGASSAAASSAGASSVIGGTSASAVSVEALSPQAVKNKPNIRASKNLLSIMVRMKKILLVDDELYNILAIEIMLQHMFKLDIASEDKQSLLHITLASWSQWNNQLKYE